MSHEPAGRFRPTAGSERVWCNIRVHVPAASTADLMGNRAPVRFLGIGPQKCASTWLHDILEEHPEICLPQVRKELDFFSYHYDYGFQWYASHFSHDARSSVPGEVSPSYFHDSDVPGRVARYNPDILIVAIFREPVSRAISNHKHEVRMGRIAGPDLSFEAGLRNNPSYVDQGRYATHLRRWLECFPRNQFLLLLFDDVIRDPQRAAQEVYRFLGVDAEFRSGRSSQKSNESYVTRVRSLDRARKAVYEAATRMRLQGLWRAVGNAGLRKAYRAFNRRPPGSVIPPPDDATVRKLADDFSDEVAALEEILGVSLDRWRSPAK